MRIQIIRRGVDGTTEQLDLTHKAGQPLKMAAKAGSRVEVLLDGRSLKGNEVIDGKKLSLRKSGKDVKVFLDGEEIAMVEGFYDAPGATLVGESWTFPADAPAGAGTADAAAAQKSSVASLPEAQGGANMGLAILGGVALLGAAGGGGGGGGSSSGGDGVVTPSTFTIKFSAAAGPVTAALDYTITNAAGTVLATGKTDASGTASGVAVPKQGGSGVLIITLKSSNGTTADYLDEATNAYKSLNGELRAMVVGADTDLSISITPVTELAVKVAMRMAGGGAVTNEIAEAANQAVGKALGLVDGSGKSTILEPFTTIFASYNEADGISNAEKYAQVLAKLSGLDARYANTAAMLDALSAQIADHPTLSGLIGTPSLTANERVAIYDGATKLGYATISGSSWSYQVMPGAMSAGTHSLTAVVEHVATQAKGTATAAFTLDVQQVTLSSVTDDVGAWTGNVLPRSLSYVDGTGSHVATNGGSIVTDDGTPTFGGSLGHALTGTQVLAVYDGASRLGTATVTGTSWSYTTPTLVSGNHTVSLQIEDSTSPGVSLMKVGSYGLNVVGSSQELGTASALSINYAGLVDLTAVSSPVQPALNKITLGGTGVSGITLKLDSSDVSLAGLEQYTTGLASSNGRHQLLIDGTTSTTNTVNVADSGWTSAGTATIAGKTYAVYNHDTTTQLLIDTLLTRTGGVI